MIHAVLGEDCGKGTVTVGANENGVHAYVVERRVPDAGSRVGIGGGDLLGVGLQRRALPRPAANHSQQALAVGRNRKGVRL